MNRNVAFCAEHCDAFDIRTSGSSCGKHLFVLCYLGCKKLHKTKNAGDEQQCDFRNCDEDKEVPDDCPYTAEMAVYK